MNNRLYFLGKWFNKHTKVITILVSCIIMTTGVAQFMVDKETIIKLLGVYVFIILFTLFRVRLSHIPLDMREFTAPVIGESVVIKKDFYYDGSFLKYLNTSNPSRKPNTLHIKKGSDWSITDVTTRLEDDWIVYMKDHEENEIALSFMETRNYWETKSEFRANRLKELGI